MNRYNLTSMFLGMFIFTASSRADEIFDKSYFDDRIHNKLTFNVDGDGNEIQLSRGSFQVMPEDAYAKRGLSRIFTAAWVRDGSVGFENLIGEFASAPIYAFIARQFEDDPSVFEFSPDVRAFGTWIFRNTRLPRPTFNAFDADGNLIETAFFDDDAIDGSRVIEGDTIEYGFLGIAADRDIAYVTFPEGGAIDDFYYTPEPSAALLLLLAGAGALRRR